MPVQESDRLTATGFRETLIEVSLSLGPHHLPLDRKASDINSFLQADSTHHALVKRAVIDIYRANRCSHLDSAIDTGRTFDALGKLYAELNSAPETDIDQIDLLEKLGQELKLLLPAIHADKTPSPGVSREDGSGKDTSCGEQNQGRYGEVIILSRISPLPPGRD